MVVIIHFEGGETPTSPRAPLQVPFLLTAVFQSVVQRIDTLLLEIGVEAHICAHAGSESGIFFPERSDQRIAALAVDLAVVIAMSAV